MADANSFQGEFLFVNKNGHDFKSRTTQESFAIGSHVSGRYTRWKKVARIRRSRRQESTPVQTRTIPGHAQASPVQDSGLLLCRRRPGSALRAKSANDITETRLTRFPITRSETFTMVHEGVNSAKITSHEDANVSSQKPRERQTSVEKMSSLNVSPQSLLKMGNSDPFHVTVVPITALNSYLMNIWRSIFLESVWPAEATTSAPALLEWSTNSKGVIEDERRIHAVLAWATTLHVSSMTECRARSKMNLKALWHKSLCLRTVRREFSTSDTGPIAMSVTWHLAGAELYAGNVYAAMLHLNALTKMVENVGGLQNVPWALRKLIIVADMTLSKMTMQPALLPVEQWDPGPIAGTGYLSPAELVLTRTRSPHHDVPENVLDIFQEFRELLSVQKIAMNRIDLLCWAQMRQYALSTKLYQRIELTHGCNGERATYTSVCLALDYLMQILWRRNHKARTQFAPFHHPISPDYLLSEALSSRPYLALWIAYIGSVVDEMCYKPFEERLSHRILLATASKLDLRFPQDVRNVLQQFVYPHACLDPYLCILVPSTSEE